MADGLRMMIRRILSWLFWAALAFAFIMAVLPQPPAIPGEPGDKIQHIAAFAVLTGLAIAARPAHSRVRVFLGLSAFGALIEIVQAIPALHRDSDWQDWMADTVAVLVVILLVWAFERTREIVR